MRNERINKSDGPASVQCQLLTKFQWSPYLPMCVVSGVYVVLYLFLRQGFTEPGAHWLG